MALADTSHAPRTYGGFRRPTTPGIHSLGSLGTILLLGICVAVIVVMTFVGLLPAIVLATVALLLLALLTVRDRDHRTGFQKAGTRLAFARTRRRGANLYRSGPLGRTAWGTHQLPGLAAASKLSEHRDSYGRPFAMLHIPSTSDYTVVLATEPDGAALVDEEQVDAWVARWGMYLADLGDEPGLVGASVTVETAPDTGTRLRREVETNVDPQAPELAQAMLREVVGVYPAAAATVRAWVALTFTARTDAGKRSTEEVARDLATRVAGLSQALHATGAGAARPVGAAELCEVVRTAYDPAAAHLLDAARAAGANPDLTWSEVGPTAHQANWDHYRHDGAVSVTWAMTVAPRGIVQSSILARLLSPHRDVDRKRVTMLYRPLDAATSSNTVDADVRAASVRSSSQRTPSARAAADLRAAQQAAAEEASGASLVNFAVMVTATVVGEQRLPLARSAVTNLAATARLRMRVVHGSQDSAFAAALPLGLVMSRHLSVPTAVRESL